MYNIDKKYKGEHFNQQEQLLIKAWGFSSSLSFDYFNEPCTTAIVKTYSAYYSLKLQYKLIWHQN